MLFFWDVTVGPTSHPLTVAYRRRQCGRKTSGLLANESEKKWRAALTEEKLVKSWVGGRERGQGERVLMCVKGTVEG